MRHNRQTHRLGRTFSERKALLDSLVGSLLTYQEIKTTLAKAKATKRVADRIITLGKADTLHARRLAFSTLQNHQLTSKLFKEVAPRFKNRKGGYTRILLLNRRKGDGAQLALLELTEKEIKVKEVKKSKKQESREEKGKLLKPAHEHETKEGHSDVRGETEKGSHQPKHPGSKKDKPQPGFFKNLGKFFRNKGFGNKGG